MSGNKNSKARIQANNRYNAKAYDRINVAIPKGQKADIQAAADVERESINGYASRAMQERMGDETLMRIIRDEGHGIGYTALAEKAGLSMQEVQDRVEDLSRKRLVYTIFGLPTAPGEFSVKLMNRFEYYEAPFKEAADKRVFAFLKEQGPRSLGDICSGIDVSELETLKSLIRLTADKRVSMSLGHRLDTGDPIPETTFAADPDAVKYIVL